MVLKIDVSGLKSLNLRIERFRSSIVPIAAGILIKQVKVLSQQQQKDFTGTPFKPLTLGYKRFKQKRGRPGLPNFTFTGKFMNRIGIRQDEAKPYVGVVDSFQPQARGLDKKRKIWGVHPDSERLTTTALEQAWEGVVNARS